jgi:hypothetical protein
MVLDRAQYETHGQINIGTLTTLAAAVAMAPIREGMADVEISDS